MRRLSWLLVYVVGFVALKACSESPAYEPKENLRAAMQERMVDMKRIKAVLDAGQTPTSMPLTPFAGLPHSEFVDGVEEYQPALAAFDETYAGLFTAADKQAQFALVVATCASCHTQVCPGPLRAIRNMAD